VVVLTLMFISFLVSLKHNRMSHVFSYTVV